MPGEPDPIPADDQSRRLTVARPDEDQSVGTRTEPPPPVSPEEQSAFIAKSMSIAPRYKTVQLPAAGHD